MQLNIKKPPTIKLRLICGVMKKNQILLQYFKNLVEMCN